MVKQEPSFHQLYYDLYGTCVLIGIYQPSLDRATPDWLLLAACIAADRSIVVLNCAGHDPSNICTGLTSWYCNCSCSTCSWTPWEGIWTCSAALLVFYRYVSVFLAVALFFPCCGSMRLFKCLWYVVYFILKSGWCLAWRLNMDKTWIEDNAT